MPERSRRWCPKSAHRRPTASRVWREDRRTVHASYVVDRHGHLVGVIPVLHLLAAQPVTSLRFIETADAMAVTPDTDEREAARLALRHHASAIPVVDRNRKLAGTIASHDLLAILQEEATADVQRLAGLRYGETALTPGAGRHGSMQTSTRLTRALELRHVLWPLLVPGLGNRYNQASAVGPMPPPRTTLIRSSV